MIWIQWLLLVVIFYTITEKIYPKSKVRIVEKYFNEIIYIWLSIIMSILLRDRLNIIRTFLTLLIVLMLMEAIKMARINQKKENTQIVLYQIFSFINNQMRAGLRLEDIIAQMYKVIDSRDIRKKLKTEGQKYLNDYNLNDYLHNISGEFDQNEFFAVEYAIKNALQIGVKDEMLNYQEEMLFNKYIGIIQKKGDRNKLKMFFTGMLLSAILVFLISYPMFVEFMESIKNFY